jgi:hypothetical protein
MNTRAKLVPALIGLVFFPTFRATATPRDVIVPQVEIVSPVLDGRGQVVQAITPDGKTFPVFRLAEESPFARRIRTVLATSFAYHVLKLDRYARNLLLWELRRRRTLEDLHEPRLTAPMYLLLSKEEGGYARFGFWLEGPRRERRLVLAGYVDQVVNDESPDTGGFEEIFSHELAHLILKSLVGDLSLGPSRKMHMSMTVTDYSAAFDEGYAEHFQPLVRDASKNPRLRELMKGSTPTDLDLLWISRLDEQLRTVGVKQNLFIHPKALPVAALEPDPDLYKVYVDGETCVDFLSDELKNAQEMMASEGVVATLFYRIVNDERLRRHYREPAFYKRFLPAEVSVATPQEAVTPYENINLKIFAAMRAMAGGTNDSYRPWMVALVKTYVTLFPDEAEAMHGTFLKTTRGVTASQEVAAAFERAAADGRRGEIEAFRQSSRAAHTLLRSLIDQVARGKLAIDGNLGPELWLLNPHFKIAPALWEPERTLPLSVNLNTASETELMSLPGVNLVLARRIVAARRARGFFRELSELEKGAGVPPDVIKSLEAMKEQMTREKPYKRP